MEKNRFVILSIKQIIILLTIHMSRETRTKAFSKSKEEQEEVMRYCQYKAWTNRDPTDACPVNSPSIKT